MTRSGRAARAVVACATTTTLLGWAAPAPAAAAPATTLVSVAPTGAPGDDSSVFSSVSADGTVVAFTSHAGNLVPGDTTGEPDVFARDRRAGTTERVSVNSAEVPSNRSSSAGDAAVSADGRFVVFESVGSNLVRTDTNNTSDVFVRDRRAGTTVRVSVRTGGGQADQDSFGGAISADGRFVVFGSAASNLDRRDTNEFLDVYLHDRRTGRTTWISAGAGGRPGDDHSLAGGVSADGRFVMFESYAGNLLPGGNDDKDVYVRDLRTGRLERVSVTTGGGQVPDRVNGGGSMSADGRLVTFVTNGAVSQVFVRDRLARTTRLASAGPGGVPGNGASVEPSISPDGRFVAFGSFATNLAPGGADTGLQVFVRDRRAGRTIRASVDTAGTPADGPSVEPECANGGVAFASTADNLVPGPAVEPMQLYFRGFQM